MKIFNINIIIILLLIIVHKMSDMWWLKISCLVCLTSQRGDPSYWPHSGCSKIYSDDNDIKIDIDENLFCNGTI